MQIYYCHDKDITYLYQIDRKQKSFDKTHCTC